MGFRFYIDRSRRIKVPRIRCNTEGIFTFLFPYRYSEKQALEDAENYIKRNHDKIKQMYMFQHGKYIKAMQYIEQNPNKLLFFDTYLHVDTLSIDSLREKFYIKVKELLDEYAEIMQLNYTLLTISNAKSYLGQCNSKAQIKIDYRNMLSHETLLRYLIVHELAHIRHPNHSKNFWQEVGTFYSNYKNARKELKEMADRNAIILRHYGLLPKKLC